MNRDHFITELTALLAETRDILPALDIQGNWLATHRRLQSLVSHLLDFPIAVEIMPLPQISRALAYSLNATEGGGALEDIKNITADLHCLETVLQSKLESLTLNSNEKYGSGYTCNPGTQIAPEIRGPLNNILLLSTDPELICPQTSINSWTGVKSHVVSDLSAALNVLHHHPINVFILDLQAAKGDTSEMVALTNEKRRTENTQLLLLAEQSDLEMLHELRPLSWECLLTKPVPPSLLHMSVHNLMQHATHSHVRNSVNIEELLAHRFETQALNEHSIVSITDRKGQITYINELFSQISGYQPDELLGKNHRLLKSGEHSDAFYRDLWCTISAGKTWKGEICNRSKDGDFYWVCSTIVPFLDNDGHPYQFVSIRTDMTATKERQLEAARLAERLRLSQRFANTGTWEWSIETDELYWSEGIPPLFGYKSGELETSYENFIGAVHPSDRSLVKDRLKQCMEFGGEYLAEHRVVWPDGQIRWVIERGDVTRDKQGKPLKMLGIVMDIHDQKMAELAKHDSEKKFRNLFARSPAGIILSDTNGKLLEVNQSLLDIMGYTKDEFYAQDKLNSLLHLLPDLSNRRLLEQHRIVNKQGPVESRLRHKDGHLLELLLNFSLIPDKFGKPLISIIIQDQTKSKQAHQELMIFRRIFESTQQSIGIADAMGKLIFFNQSYLELHVRTKEVMIDQSITSFFMDSSSSTLTDEIMTDLFAGKSWSGLLPIERGDGSSLMTDNNFGTVYGPDGSVQFLFNIASDYSSEIKLQEKLMAAKEIAERANQAKSEFLSSMSHELRTPMNAILGFAQLLEYDDDLDDEQQDSVNEISSAGQHLLALINEVLDLAKIEAGHVDLSLEPVHIWDLLSECNTLLAPMAQQRKITLRQEERDDYYARADHTRLKQVLLNLISNAIKYNREQGTVSLDLILVDKDTLRITISDTGYGISQEQQNQLFQPFNRLGAEDSEIEGSGIGLSIAQNLIEMMAGHIGMESEEGVGTRFWLELPRELPVHQTDKSTPGICAVNTANAPFNRSYQVLYIDDNPVNLRLVSQILSKRQHIDLFTAHEPELGLELASAHQPDLILLDINMPRLNGYQVLSALRSDPQLEHIPVIAVSADAMPQHIAKGKDFGFSGYLTKPLDVVTFSSTVDYYLTATPNMLQADIKMNQG